MMNCKDFVDLLTASSDGLKVEHQELLDGWRPEEPPITTLFSAFGERIAKDFRNVDIAKNRYIFLLIEQAMASSDQELVTAVATGLIEALVNRAVEEGELWVQMTPFLGSKSLNHARVWLNC